MEYDKIIIGAGIYGLYATLFCAKKNEKILVLEKEDDIFKRASYVNQARVHMGYHYPRSYSTAIKLASYFERFNKDYGFSILSEFDQIYAISKNFSLTSSQKFKHFCRNVNIPYEEVPINRYFKEEMCDGAFLTHEYTYDAQILKDYFINELKKYPNVTIKYRIKIDTIREKNKLYELDTNEGIFKTSYLLNTTYSSVNQILAKLGFEQFKVKYELCEIILCKVSDEFKNIGITVMDGPFFSIMPFGKTGYHSLTSVAFTPHETCYNTLPNFSCQRKSNGYCSKENLGNCNNCNLKPKSAWNYMSKLAQKYLKDNYSFEYVNSLFSVKPVLQASEIDDARPTVIKTFTTNPTFISVLSGKISTIYDLEEVLK